MGQHRANAISAADLGYLLEPGRATQAHTVGQLRWRRIKEVTHEGVAEVATGLVTVSDGRLNLHFTTHRRWEVKLVYLVNAVPVRRACLNSKHNGLPFGDHIHNYVPRTGVESCVVSEDFSTVPMVDDVDNGVLRTAFHEFAAACSITVSADCWTDPPTK